MYLLHLSLLLLLLSLSLLLILLPPFFFFSITSVAAADLNPPMFSMETGSMATITGSVEIVSWEHRQKLHHRLRQPSASFAWEQRQKVKNRTGSAKASSPALAWFQSSPETYNPQRCGFNLHRNPPVSAMVSTGYIRDDRK
uniref:Uncharacterized protein n=1 Tax=Nelumbo nucifera TaxID=4432 RepID=A0A822Y7Z2_NELNU|nr:TPA_asm: hypothetical protein HUJ06_029631 [Nelumbo nucifera]